ncbi:MAG: type II secretion system protein GspL [Thermodesulfobacteriota bacterium]
MNPAKKNHFLFLGPEAPGKVAWAAWSATDGFVVGQGPLSEAHQLQGEKVVVLVPGTEVLLTEAIIPGNSGRIIKKSIPFALEENLADEIEDLHFAHGVLRKNGAISVAVVAKAQMESWLAILNEHDIEVRSLVPATMAIPLTPEQWSLVLTDSQFMLRKGTWQAYAGDIGSLPVFLAEELAADSAQQPSLQLYTDEDCSINCEEAVPAMGISVRHRKPLLQLLVDGYDEKKMINLLQGDYSRHAGWRDLWLKWQLPIVAVVLLCLMNIGAFSFDYYRLKSGSAELNERIKAIYLQSFPGSRRVVNARAQMEQKLAELQEEIGAHSSFFEVYDKTLPLFLATSGFSLNNLRFNNGRFDFDFEIKDLQSLETLKHNLASIPGIVIDIKHAEATGNRVKAKIQIKSRKKQ